MILLGLAIDIFTQYEETIYEEKNSKWTQIFWDNAERAYLFHLRDISEWLEDPIYGRDAYLKIELAPRNVHL